MRRLMVMMIALALMAVFFAGCGDDGATEPEDEVADEEVVVEEPSQEEDMAEEPADDEDTFTLAELAEFDGMEGRPAYVAVDGVVFDITGSALWPEGEHSPCGLDAMAGRDLSEVIGESPHGRDIFNENGIPVVGTLEE